MQRLSESDQIDGSQGEESRAHKAQIFRILHIHLEELTHFLASQGHLGWSMAQDDIEACHFYGRHVVHSIQKDVGNGSNGINLTIPLDWDLIEFMTKQTINPPELFNSVQYGFSQIVTSTGGKTIYLSGQVAWNEKQEIIGGDDLGEQTRQALRNVETAVRIAGGQLSDVVSMRIYFLDAKKDETDGITNALLDFFPSTDPPATTWIGVPSLANDGFLVEVEAVAVVEDID